jgi:PEP-CTERM motif
MKTVILYASIVSVLTAVANAQNANVTWGTPATISGTSDVNTSGTLFGTWAPGDDYYGDETANAANYTVNGVDFLTYGTPVANFSFINQASLNDNLDRYNGFANPNTADSIYNNLLQVAVFNWNSPNAMEVNWTGMTPNDTYLVELWLNDGRSGQTGTSTFAGGANTSDSVAIGNGAPGQYIIGTFVADSSGTEDITISPGIMLNLVQVRDITPVPEPSTFAFLALGTGAMLFGFRRKNREV